MQDKPLHQQRLSRDLASITETLNDDVVLPFLDAFWKTMSREWANIEALRMDKYLYLIRQVLNQSFRFLSRGKWGNSEAIEEYVRILEETPCDTTEPRIPNGLRYHVMDIYVDELEKVGGEEWEVETLEKLLEPLRKLAKEGMVRSIRDAAKEALDDDRLKKWRGEEVKAAEDEKMDDSNDGWGGFDD